MLPLTFTSAIVALFFLTVPLVMSGKVTNPSRVPKNAVLLSKVSTLTLRDGKKTSSRRVAAVPQLECIGPKDVCELYKVDAIRCVNEGTDYDAANVQWSCKANLPEEFKLGSTDVVCEGYESSDDPYVLKDSCGVEYRLLLTEKGEQKYRTAKRQKSWQSNPVHVTYNNPSSERKSEDSSIFTVLFWLIFGGVILYILKTFISSYSQDSPRPRTTRRLPDTGSSHGNNNDDHGDDPPPPYDSRPSYFPSQTPKKPSTRYPRAATSTQASSSRGAPRQQQSQSWRPGFWSGTAAGAAAATAAGYAMGNVNRSSDERRAREAREQMEMLQRQRQGAGGAGFFDNLWGTGRSNQQRDSTTTTSTTTSMPEYSASHYESTGFGETRRR